MSRLRRTLQGVIQALWVEVIPALLAALVMKFLVPPRGPGLPGAIGALGHGAPIPLAVALFFAFSLLARHWRFRLPGGRYASALPAHVAPDERDPERLAEWADAAALGDEMASRFARRRVAALEEPQRSEVETRVAELGQALEATDLATARAAAASLQAVASPVLRARRSRETVITLAGVAAAAAVALGARALVAEPYHVESGSMIPTFEPDDRVLGRRVRYAEGALWPQRGEVVIFGSSAVAVPVGAPGPLPDTLIKRVVGLPGDVIAMRGETPVVNGWPVPTCVAGAYLYITPDGGGDIVQGSLVVEFLEDRAYLTVHSAPTPPFSGAYVVPPGQVFVLGDSRGNSVDSRAYGGGEGGGVPLANIVARADRFLLGTHRGGETDFSRLFQPIARVEHRLRLEGMSPGKLDEGIAKCLASAPKDTHPPPPAGASLEATPKGGRT
jgi:signal peptidase I